MISPEERNKNLMPCQFSVCLTKEYRILMFVSLLIRLYKRWLKVADKILTCVVVLMNEQDSHLMENGIP